MSRRIEKDDNPPGLWSLVNLLYLEPIPYNPSNEDSYYPNYGHSARPFVGPPFLELNFEDPKPFRSDGGVNTGPSAPKSSIRLRFKPTGDYKLTDQVLYRASMANRA